MPLDPLMDLLPGTLDLLILRILDAERLHGYAIARRIEQLSRDELKVEQGSLYPALYRLERAGLVRGRAETSASGRRVKTYALTTAGRHRLAEEADGWDRFVEAVGRIMKGYAR